MSTHYLGQSPKEGNVLFSLLRSTLRGAGEPARYAHCVTMHIQAHPICVGRVAKVCTRESRDIFPPQLPGFGLPRLRAEEQGYARIPSRSGASHAHPREGVFARASTAVDGSRRSHPCANHLLAPTPFEPLPETRYTLQSGRPRIMFR